MERDRILAELARAQHGIFTRTDARAAGFTDAAIARRLRNGQWERVAPGVFRIAGTPPSWHQQVLVSVLAAGAQAVASHRTAAVLHDLAGFRAGIIDVTAPRWLRQPLAGVRTHESLDLKPDHCTERLGIATTTVARTLVDLGAVCPPHRVGVALDDARRRRLVTLGQMRRLGGELSKQGRAGVGVMRGVLAERPGGSVAPTSAFETRLLSLITNGGLPRPECQWQVRDGTFVAYLDFAYPSARLAIEADSEEFHLDLERFHHDRARRNRLELLGWRVLCFTHRQLRRSPHVVLDQIRQGLSVPA